MCEHEWVHTGGCQCWNERTQNLPGVCSRPVHECSKCGVSDFGMSDAADRECERCPQRQRPCAHIPKKAALDSSVWCIRCAAYLGEAN